jgi:hypothetical protein
MTSVDFLKEEVFEICGALALCESLLASLGLSAEADHVAGVFETVEGRLGERQPSESDSAGAVDGDSDSSPGLLS